MVEGGAVLCADGLLGLRLDGEGVDGFAILVDAEVEVRAGREACGADVADDLFLCNHVADLEPLGEAREMHVGGGVGAVVAYLHVVATTIGILEKQSCGWTENPSLQK